MDRYKIVIIIVFSIISIVMLNSNIADNLYSNQSNNSNIIATTNILIYDGDGVMESSVEGIEECLNKSNYENLTPNNKFEYSTASIINSNTLSGYDVLIMPGGDAQTYLENDDIDSKSLKLFVQDGNGYLGICAGAYAASNYVEGYYPGWAITPDVITKNENYEGLLQISTTSTGSKIINGSITSIHMQNGPAMYTNDTKDIMAIFADNNTGYKNYAAIVADTYGSGRVILSGPHPEADPKNPQLLVNMIQWISKKM